MTDHRKRSEDPSWLIRLFLWLRRNRELVAIFMLASMFVTAWGALVVLTSVSVH